MSLSAQKFLHDATTYIYRTYSHLHAYLSRLLGVFPGVPLNINGAPVNIQGNLDSPGYGILWDFNWRQISDWERIAGAPFITMDEL